MDNTKRRNTYIFWGIMVILVSILATYVKNIYTLILQVVVILFALYRLLKIDQMFDPQKRRAILKSARLQRKN
ncbi:hypothetical protein [Xylocopilactobacillus apis]|uniref:Uncharacterized protein n=1 Tax=Xylocopilactobacillus apis TaxID=2932183 RepID=A0AAU9D005_9LACO|nr:hypothetical protein [Xylocopilactobacillus apis]BDR55595.1 hypothetical protein KIMC2_01570 [Xylocopilactobacillus apis]